MKYIPIVALLLAFTPSAVAQGAAERAAALKQWKADCSQEDPDLRLAYIEDAIINQGATVARLCARQALESKDPDTRALGLRAALAMTEVITFPFEMPVQYEKDMAIALADDAEAVKNVENKYSYVKSGHKNFGGAFTFKQKKVSLEKASGEWFIKDEYGRFDDRYEAQIVSTADTVRVEGSLNGDSITINLRLGAGGLLTGEAVYDGHGPYPVIAELL